ncbi:pseudouridine-5'-phosphate glycosidase [Rhodosalinus sediminis]|uniref:pseudouridine-5'-phosphate glycosidase n=1 Tax=Rhodosalinus sediminis TaxID=1940533 RepID=UPI002355DB0E|nr:pseudouridine-5'-phosphate glycosidase [Rhodosalinus sediminis]
MIRPDLSDEVAGALAAGRPVVALESTIVSHGLPWPRNLELAQEVAGEVRAGGAVPATVAVIDGRLRAGLDAAALERLARGAGVAKLSRADLAVCMAEGRTGATTVAATMIAAARAGIDVFATGGIGGVHRGAETSFDVSADLRELAQSPVTVVASGAKAILDLPKTLEVLETLGVPVLAVGQDAFPAFWARDSGLPAPLRMDDPAAIARAHLARGALGLAGGQLVANPIPAEAEIPLAELAPLIARAEAEVAAEGVTGKAVTPALLDRLRALTEGRTLDANAALVRANARLGAAIAQEIAAARAGGAKAPAPPL